MYLSISIRSSIKCCFVTQMAELSGHSLPEKEFICTFFKSLFLLLCLVKKLPMYLGSKFLVFKVEAGSDYCLFV